MFAFFLAFLKFWNNKKVWEDYGHPPAESLEVPRAPRAYWPLQGHIGPYKVVKGPPNKFYYWVFYFFIILLFESSLYFV